MKSIITLAVSMLVLPTSAAHSDIILTGMTVSQANASGDRIGGTLWDTTGGNGLFNLYLTNAGQPIGGTLANSGDGASLAPSITLAEGTNSFFLFGDTGLPLSFFAANLFFNSAATPGVSALAPLNTSAIGPFNLMTANASLSTQYLDGSLGAGAGSLSFSDGLQIATVTEFAWADTPVFAVDRISAFSHLPSGGNDSVGVLTINVTSVPEPSSAIFMLAATPLFAWRRRRRNTR